MLGAARGNFAEQYTCTPWWGQYFCPPTARPRSTFWQPPPRAHIPYRDSGMVQPGRQPRNLPNPPPRGGPAGHHVAHDERLVPMGPGEIFLWPDPAPVPMAPEIAPRHLTATGYKNSPPGIPLHGQVQSCSGGCAGHHHGALHSPAHCRT